MCFSDFCLSYPYLKHTNQGLHVSLHSSLPEAIHKPPWGHPELKKSNPELQTTTLFNGCWLKQAFLLMDVGLNKCFCWWMLASTSIFVKGSLIKQRFFYIGKDLESSSNWNNQKKKGGCLGYIPGSQNEILFLQLAARILQFMKSTAQVCQFMLQICPVFLQGFHGCTIGCSLHWWGMWQRGMG